MHQEALELLVQVGVPDPPTVTLVEHKGSGHPDTLADHLAEELSRAYSRFTLESFGAVLHHNFDKLALLGGASEVRYGGGRMLSPVRVLVNGRASRTCGGVEVPIADIVGETVRRFFTDRLPELAEHVSVELNVTANPSPGAVHGTGAAPERAEWFAPSSVERLRERRTLLANDTSIGTGWAPENPVERFVRALAGEFSPVGEFGRAHRWCGSDVKVLALAEGRSLDVALCVPQKSRHVLSRSDYLAHCRQVRAECDRLAGALLPDHVASFQLNGRDVVERDELYLTYSGSSIESGDEGVVGRGNRVNGLITPMRPMSIEGASGKNLTAAMESSP